jgi:hypothetical protein
MGLSQILGGLGSVAIVVSIVVPCLILLIVYSAIRSAVRHALRDHQMWMERHRPQAAQGQEEHDRINRYGRISRATSELAYPAPDPLKRGL